MGRNNGGKYKIESGVPVPKKGQFQSKYPFRKMELGQSFSINDDETGLIRGAATTHNARHPDTWFSVRLCEDGIFRCFRER